MSQPWGVRVGEPSCLVCDGLGEGKIPSTFHHHLRQAGELAPPLTSCSTQKSGPCTPPGQHSRVGPRGVDANEQASKVMRAGEPAPPLADCCTGCASPGGKDEGELVGSPTHLRTTHAQNQGCELAHPNVHPICELLERPVLQIQSCTISITQGNNRISKRSPSEGLCLNTSICSVAEARGLEPDQ